MPVYIYFVYTLRIYVSTYLHTIHLNIRVFWLYFSFSEWESQTLHYDGKYTSVEFFVFSFFCCPLIFVMNCIRMNPCNGWDAKSEEWKIKSLRNSTYKNKKNKKQNRKIKQLIIIVIITSNTTIGKWCWKRIKYFSIASIRSQSSMNYGLFFANRYTKLNTVTDEGSHRSQSRRIQRATEPVTFVSINSIYWRRTSSIISHLR